MSEKIEKFLELVQAEFQYYKDLRNLLRREQKALVLNDLKEINKIIPLKEDLLFRIKEFKDNREKLSEEIFKKEFISFPDIIRELKTTQGLSAGDELDELYQSAVAIISEVILLNSRNDMLLRQSLSITRNVLKKITTGVSAGTYTRNGEQEEKMKNRNLVNKQV